MGLTARETPCADDRGGGDGPASSNTRSTAPLRITCVRYFRPKVRLHRLAYPKIGRLCAVDAFSALSARWRVSRLTPSTMTGSTRAEGLQALSGKPSS